MRLYLDQMFRVELVNLLKGNGHDALRASEVGQGRADDAEILAKAMEERRVLVTMDEHFGDWAVLPLHRHPGVIRVKARPTTTTAVANVLIPFLEGKSEADLEDYLVILTDRRQRWIRTAE